MPSVRRHRRPTARRRTKRARPRLRVKGSTTLLFQLPYNGGAAFRDTLCARDDRARAYEVAKVIEHILVGDSLDPNVIDALAQRETFPIGADRLARIACDGATPIIASLFERHAHPNVRLFRLATDCRAVPPQTSLRADLFKPAKFRSEALRLKSKRAERARVALAAFGEPLGTWSALTRHERAAYALHSLVSNRRDRS